MGDIGVKVLSLFDGMACGMLAMQKAGVEVEAYHAYEIDKYAVKTAQHNFPDIQEHGDVFTADFTVYRGRIDFLVGGSPCTYWSIAQTKNRETEASGLGWDLFSQYVRALHEVRPRYFIYENNKSMSKAIRDQIRETFGFEEICINSALVSAQNRQRYYWVGKRNQDGTYSKVDVQQPEDLGILLKDVLDGCPVKEKGNCLAGNRGGMSIVHDMTESRHNLVAEPVNTTADGKAGTLRATCYKDGIRNLVANDVDRKTGVAEPVPETDFVPFVEKKLDKAVERYGYIPEMWNPYNNSEITEKTPTITASCSRQTASSSIFVARNIPQYAAPCEWDSNGIPTRATSGADGKTYTVYPVQDGQITIKGKEYPIKLVDGYYIIRKLTVSECKRLQTVPEWYDFSCVSNSQAYKMLGNGWTVDVIAHLIRACLGVNA